MRSMGKNTRNLVCTFAVLCLFGCASMNSLIVGKLPSKTRCLAVIPFVTSGELAGDEEILSYFLALDLAHEKIEGIIYPKEIKRAYDEAGAVLPYQVDRLYAADVGKVIGCDAVVWGDLSYRAIWEGEGEAARELRLISVQAFLVIPGTGDVKWYYDTKKTTPEENTVKTLGQVSTEMKWGLLRGLDAQADIFKGSCFKSQLHKRLSVFLKGAEYKAAQAVKKPEAKTQYPLSVEEKEIHDSLMSGKSLVLRQIGFTERDTELSKQGIVFLGSLSKVVKNVGDGYKFVFTGHVDATADTAADMSISLDRVKNIKRVLVNLFGIDPEVIGIRALGGQKPILPNVTERSRQKNHRIELKLYRAAK